MKIVLDTSVLYRNWFLRGPQIDLLRRHSASGRSAVIIPSVVILELKNQYLEQTSKHITEAEKLNSMLPPGWTALPLPIPQDLAREYLQHLQKRITDLGFREVGFTGIAHDHIIEKALKKQKPFNSNGKGYRDSLIWETILQNLVSDGETTYLVTENHRDFAVENQKELHPDLVEDVRQLGLQDSRVAYIPNLNTLIDSYIVPDMPAVVSAQLDCLRSGRIGDSSFTDWINENKEKIVDSLNKTEITLGHLLGEMESISLENMEDAESFEVVSVSAINEESAVVVGTAEIEANLNFFIFKSHCYCYEPPYPFSVWDGDWNDHYVAAETSVCLSLRFVFSVSIDTDEIVEFEVENHTELWGYCMHCGAIQYSDAAETCSSCNRPLF